jgi:phosphate transport system substrate-binding protein
MTKLAKVCRALLTASLLAWPAWSIAETIVTGAGASFPAPVYSMWLKAYQKIRPGAQFDYQAVGSGSGIRNIMEGKIDYGASDAPMTDKQMQDFKDKHGYGILHFPTVIGAAVPAYNVAGASDLNFTPDILAGIYLGRITKWNDPLLHEANPTANLPASDIIVTHRSDGSGTTYIWTDYLSKISDVWKSKAGKGLSVNWPVGIGARGNDGVADLIQRTPYALGYVELSYALQKHLAFGRVRNAAGVFIKADLASVTAAAADTSQSIPDDFRMSVTNASGKDAFPIASFSWLLIPSKIQDAEKKKAVVDFLTWSLKDGQSLTQDLVYARLPERVVSKELAAISKIQ